MSASHLLVLAIGVALAPLLFLALALLPLVDLRALEARP
jgi:hypothetical protein